MSPRMEADFDWGDVQASTPIHPKGDYELTIKRVRGSAWRKDGAEHVTQVIRLTPVIVGEYDAENKLDTAKAGQAVEDINIWVHSDGGRKMGKGHMMAIAGYNSDDAESEEEFNGLISEMDLASVVEEKEDGGYNLLIGDGWETLLVGNNVRAHMEPETREIEGRDPVTQQNFKRLSPVNT